MATDIGKEEHYMDRPQDISLRDVLKKASLKTYRNEKYDFWASRNQMDPDPAPD